MRRSAILLLFVLAGLAAGAGAAGPGAFLGVSLGRAEEVEPGAPAGAQVMLVVEESPAARAGMEDGDLIVEFDRQAVAGPGHLQDLLAAHAAGDKVDFKVRRDGKVHKLTVELGQAEDVEPLSRVYKKVVIRGRPSAWLGLRLQDLTGQLAEHFGVPAGVLVAEVVADSPAAAAGLKAGDVVVKLDGEPVETAEALTDAVAEKQPGDKVALETVRAGQHRTVEIALAEPPEGAGQAGSAMHWFSDDGQHFAELNLPDLEQLQELKELRVLGDFSDHPGVHAFHLQAGSDLRAEIEALKKSLDELRSTLQSELEQLRRELSAQGT